MDVGDDRDAHRGRRTIPRATVVAAAAGWGVAAFLLLGDEVPRLDLPAVDPRSLFSAGELDRIETFRGGGRLLWAASTGLELLALAALAWRGRAVAGAIGRRVRGRVRTGVVLGLTCSVAVWLSTLPVAAADHWWRRRYGLSEQAYGGWLRDRAVSLGLTSLLVGIAVAGAVALAGRLGRRWWVPGGAALATLGVLVALAQPLAIDPLFNRFTPLPDRALAAGIERLGERLGVAVGEVDVADASRRTTAANARVAGIGPTRRVVLYDTLLDGRFTREEILSVSAHELAHVARDHVWKGVAWFALLAVPSLALVARIAERRGGLADPATVPLALLCAFALFVATLPIQSAVSRRYEREADWLALTATGDPDAAIGLERRFVLTALADPDPPAWSRALLGTHPTPLERIGMARAFAARGG